MTTMTPADVGRIVHDRRVERGLMTREALAEATGLTSRTLSDIEVGRRYSYSRSTLTRLEQVLEMKGGSIQAMLDEAAATRAPTPALQPELSTEVAPDEPRTVDHPAEIARAIRRDDFVPVWMLTNAGLSGADLLRAEMVVRQAREECERRHVLPALEATIRDLGGTVSYPWDEV